MCHGSLTQTLWAFIPLKQPQLSTPDILVSHINTFNTSQFDQLINLWGILQINLYFGKLKDFGKIEKFQYFNLHRRNMADYIRMAVIIFKKMGITTSLTSHD